MTIMMSISQALLLSVGAAFCLHQRSGWRQGYTHSSGGSTLAT